MKTLKRIFICICTVFLLGLVSCSKSPIDEFLDNMEALSVEAQTLVKQVQNDEISETKFVNEMQKWLKKVDELDSNAPEVNMEDLTSAQQKRIQKIMQSFEELNDIADNFYY